LDFRSLINVDDCTNTIVNNIDCIIDRPGILIISLDLEVCLLILWKILIGDEIPWVLQSSYLDRILNSLLHINNGLPDNVELTGADGTDLHVVGVAIIRQLELGNSA